MRHPLSYLLRIALGNGSYNIPLDDVNWDELIDLSYSQGVASIAVDGLQKLYDANPELELTLGKPELENLKYEWFGAAISDEQNYSRIKTTAQDISVQLREAGIKALLVKGLSYASYYPIPEHRTFGDIDIFSPTSYQAIDSMLKGIAENFSVEYYRHSHCSLNGIAIENHKHLCDIRGQKRWMKLEKELVLYADEVLSSKKEGGLFFPDSRLSVLFFLYHAQSHLVFESISLRFLTDWAMILRGEKELLSSDWFSESISKFDLEKITGVLTSLCIKNLGVDRNTLPEPISRCAGRIEESLKDKVICDIFREGKEGFGDSSLRSRLSRAFVMFERGWKYREFLGVSPYAFVLEKWCGIVKEKVLKSEK